MWMQDRVRQTARLWSLAAVAVVAFSTEATPVLADDSINTGYFGGVAIMGYDPVAYFTDHRAVKGSEEYSYDWLGTPWHFASRKHMEMFEAEPVAYAPQYGGYCAAEVAGSSTVTVNVDPESFKIIDGKLYLIYDKVHTDEFAAHASEQVPKGDTNWPMVKADLEVDQYH
jgi:YHS domain-containing protein